MRTVDARPLAITFPFLLGVYAAIPLCLALQALDAVWWGGALRISLPDPATSGFWGYAAMGIPHIIGSSVVMASNGEYVRRFGARLGWTMVWIAGFFAFSLLVPFDVAFAVLGVLTIAHLFHQQMGIGKGICRAPPRVYRMWVWTSIGLGSLLYNHMYLSARMPPATRAAVDLVLLAVAAVFLGQTAWIDRGLDSTKGRVYLWANAAMVLASVYFYFTGWFFFAALAPRLIHDTTAFAFYVVHDVNRDRAGAATGFRRAVRALRVGTWWVTPAIAIALTLLIQRWGDVSMRALFVPVFGAYPSQGLVVYPLVFLTLLHYSTEAVTWKKGSPYRAYVPVTV